MRMVRSLHVRSLPNLSLPCSQVRPSREEFRSLCHQYDLIPIYTEVLADLDTPVSALLKIGINDTCYLLESVEQGERVGRYSFVGNSAAMAFSSHGRTITVRTNGSCQTDTVDDPLEILEELMSRYHPAPVADLPPFFGGAIGYLAYDAARGFLDLDDGPPDDLGLAEAFFLFTDTVLIFDHVNRTLLAVHNTKVEGDLDQCYDRGLAAIDDLLEKLSRTEPPRPRLALPQQQASFRSSVTEEHFIAAVKECQRHIAEGTTDQIVLSQRLSTPVQAEPLDIYRVLRTLNPSPYMFYLQLPDCQLIGSSPELMVQVQDDQVSVRPIAGTRPRGRNSEEDAQYACDLLADEKERAEHLMLLDLSITDLRKVCKEGSVQVDGRMSIERYSHVMHMASHVSGRLAEDRTPFDVLKATFPAGTVSGAPRVRAMQIIDELEPVRRGPYAGCVGHLGFGGNMNTCITIRTLVLKDGVAHVQAGAGIVAASDPKKEYEETLKKAQVLLQAASVQRCR
jgi:anthranilate synthase component 1